MGHYIQGEFDFVTRTKSIIEQYNNIDFSKSTDEKYEITLCMNCLMGLVVIPQQVWIDEVPKTDLSSDWFIKDSHIKFIEGDKYKINEIVRHLRNSVSHGHLIPISMDKGSNKKVTHLRFIDYFDDSKTKRTFEAKIPVETLKKFAIKFANTMLEIMSAE
jgi:hypothetical protein